MAFESRLSANKTEERQSETKKFSCGQLSRTDESRSYARFTSAFARFFFSTHFGLSLYHADNLSIAQLRKPTSRNENQPIRDGSLLCVHCLLLIRCLCKSAMKCVYLDQ